MPEIIKRLICTIGRANLHIEAGMGAGTGKHGIIVKNTVDMEGRL